MTEPLTDAEIAALAHAWEIDDAAPLLEDHVDVRRPIYMHDVIATFAADRKRIEAAEIVIADLSRDCPRCGFNHGATTLAAYRKAYPAKKGD